MRPIEHRTDAAFSQALRCVSFRIPVRAGQTDTAFGLALGLRYGLIGVAAADHLLLSCPDREEPTLTSHLQVYGDLVQEHVQKNLLGSLNFPSKPEMPERIAALAREPLEQFLPLYRQLHPLELCLSVLSDQFSERHRQEITAGVGIFRRGAARQRFHTQADESFLFALNFFERQQLNLEEVREIALIGE